MRKRNIAIGAVILHVVIDLALIFGLWRKPAEQENFGNSEETAEEQEQTGTEANETEPGQSGQKPAMKDTTAELIPDPDREFPMTENEYEYGIASQSDFYVLSEELTLRNEDTQSIAGRYELPAFERMNDEDAAEKMSKLQVLERMEVLEIDVNEILTPEYGWKAVYNDSIVSVREALAFDEEISFKGTKASELNAFLVENAASAKADMGCQYVNIQTDTLILDETIRVPSNVILDGNGVSIIAAEGKGTKDKGNAGNGENEENRERDYAILIENAQNVGIYNMHLDGGFGQGIYVITSDHVLIWNNEITNAAYKAICVMGENSYINLVNNSIHDNGNGAIFYNGNISNCILQGNSVYQNRGTRNLTAGVVFSAMYVEDIYTPYNPFLDEYLYEQTKAPHHNVLKDNLIQGNYSSGFYCDGGYLNYVIGNTIEENEKEGMCLDYGTFGTYVRGNSIKGNGDRNRQTDEDLEADFILGYGRLKDGSSKAKLPGLSIDNSAYNIVYNNNISENSGSGVKMVRSGYRNLILSNVVADNNRGINESYHGFGIELGYAVEPDEPVIGLDFTPDYENIIARNVITGGHSSGIYLAPETYCNDLIDNVIADCEFAVENLSGYFNSAVGNSTNVPCLEFELN